MDSKTEVHHLIPLMEKGIKGLELNMELMWNPISILREVPVDEHRKLHCDRRRNNAKKNKRVFC